MGESSNPVIASLLGLVGSLLVLLAVIAYISGVLKRFRRISAAEAVRFGASQGRVGGARRFRLSATRLFSTNAFLGIKDALARKGLYGTMLAVPVISAFIMIVPQNLNHTISSEGFVRYMGIGSYDLHIHVQQSDDVAAKAADIVRTLTSDQEIAQVASRTTKTFRVKMADGAEEQLKIELGDHSVFPVAYSQGRAPAAEGEIALSVMNADALGKGVGDRLTLVIAGEAKEFIVTGIYSDIKNGGKTARTVAVGEFTAQTLGSTLNAVQTASYVAVVVALLMTVLITLLFMRLLVAKDRYAIAALKAIGFTNQDIRAQYGWRSILVLAVGVVVGTLLANTLGEVLASVLISQLGATSFAFVVNPVSAYVLSPLLIVGAVLIATAVGTAGAGQIKIADNIKE